MGEAAPMKYVAYDGSYYCYLSENGRDATRLGCSHKTPRQAIQHTSGTYAPASRSAAQPHGQGHRDAAALPTETPDSAST
jgi:hypothetical protein